VRHFQLSGGAVDEGHPVEEKSGGESAEKEILERRFERVDAHLAISGHHIEGDGEDLQPEKHDQKMGGRSHDHKTENGQEQQSKEIAILNILFLDAVEGDQHREQTAEEKESLEGQGEPVNRDHARKTPAGTGPQPDGRHQGRHEPGQRDGGEKFAAQAAPEERQQQEKDGCGQDNELRGDQIQLDQWSGQLHVFPLI